MPAARPRSIVFDWFRAKYGSPTPAQKAAWPLIRAGKNVLIASPTGTGKTFAAFLSVLDALADNKRGAHLALSVERLAQLRVAHASRVLVSASRRNELSERSGC